MISDRRNRAAVKRRLVLLADSLGPLVLVDGADPVTVPAVYGTPPAEATESCIYFGASGPVEGESAPTALASSKPTADTYAVKGTADAYGYSTPADAEEAAERILIALDALISRCSHLIDPTGEIPNGFDGQCPYAVQSAHVTASTLVSGSGDDNGNTWGGRYEFTVTCTTSLRHPR